ncbi:MAG: UDP-glucuronic acid decarboxylase family protein [Pararhizobium sp.]
MTGRIARIPLRTIVVAGGGGFLGSHLCQTLLEEGHRVICIDNFVSGARENLDTIRSHPRFRLIEHDVCKPLDRDLGELDEVYNLACAASPPRYQADPIHTMTTSVVGTLNLLELAERSGARLLQASTSEVYGDPDQHPQREDYRGSVNCTGPRACYDEGKRAAEALCFDFLRLGRVDVRVSRIFNTYGPRMRPDDGRIISNLICQALSSVPMTIYGSGEQTRSFCYVSDLIDGLIALMRVEANPGSPVNLGNPGEFTINALAGIVSRLVATRSKIVHRPLPEDDPRQRCPDIERANQLLGWEPHVPLDEGLVPTVAWFRSTMVSGAPRELEAS